MRQGLLALLAAGLLILPGHTAYAQDGPDACTAYALDQAIPLLMESYKYSPQGYGPFGYAPLTYPFGAGPYGVAALFGGPGVPFGSAPAFGPLGPGLTSNFIANRIFAPAGTNLYNTTNAGTLTSLAGLQQAELGQLSTRYSNSAYYQTAAATWAGIYATQASATFTRAQAECQQRQQLQQTST